MNIHVHSHTSCSIKFHEIESIPYRRDQLIEMRQSKGNNSVSETNVTNFDVHNHAIAKYSITIGYMKFPGFRICL